MKKWMFKILMLFPFLLLSQKKLSLEKSRKLALEQNNEILARREGIQAAEDQEKAAFKNFFPKFDLEGSYTRLNKNFKYTTPDLSLPVYESKTDLTPSGFLRIPSRELKIGEKNTYLFNFTLSQPLFTGGKIKGNYDIKGYKKNIAQLSKQLSEQEKLYQTSKYYWKIKALQQKVKLAQEYKDMVETHLKDIENYQKEGLVNKNEVLKARVKKSDAEVRILKARNGLQLARKTFCQYIGLPLNTNIMLTDSLIIQDSINTRKNFKRLAKEYREEIEILEEKENLTSTRLKLVKAKYWPDLLLKAGYFGVHPNPFNSLKPELGKDWRVSINFSLPIFNWNKRGNQLTATRHKKKQIQYKIEERKEKIALEVEKTLNNLRQSHKIVAKRELALEEAQENLRVAEDNFQAGRIKSAELIEAQTMWRKAYTQYIESKKDYKIARAKLVRTIGKADFDN